MRCSGAFRAAFVAAVLGALSCGDALGDRETAASAAARAQFGDDDQLTLVVEPGIVRAATTRGATVHASAPAVTLRIDNGTPAEAALRLRVGNVRTDWAWRAEVGPLTSGSRRSRQCEDDAFAERPRVVVAAPSPVRAGTTTVELDTRVDGCSTLTLHAGLPLDAVSVRWVAIPSFDGRPERLVGYLGAAVAADAAFVAFVGGAQTPFDGAPLSYALAVAQAAGLPAVFAVAPGDVRRGADVTETIGASRFAFLLGLAPVVVLDTGSHRLTADQVALISRVERAGTSGVAVASQSPVALGDSAGVRDARDGREAWNMLGARGVSFAITGDGASYASRPHGATTLVALGRSGSDAALVTVDDPWGAPTVTVSPLSAP